MDPLLRGALLLSLVALLTRAAELRATPFKIHAAAAALSEPTSTRPRGSTALPSEAACPRGTLPDANVCIPVPDPDAPSAAQALLEQQNEHHDRSGQLRVYDQIPRQPDPKTFANIGCPCRRSPTNPS